MLTVKAERREEQKGLNRTEFRYGMLRRSVRLPANADESGIKAVYRKGIIDVVALVFRSAGRYSHAVRCGRSIRARYRFGRRGVPGRPALSAPTCACAGAREEGLVTSPA
ncbi:hypothetical protein DMB66_14395 [Actinoplanes sp. ATCC 53533]|uniref:Hsp20/alpha crystallin family protein n=1 Tax=Actinoplanes sp. ATCC 53533 TaxID=1288362 RepID=UPI000F7B611A|nr:Hsp20/alpha crystallin family protein [Actinoplanes sp. ATCC 53533]RSM68099.1 hypothetical protein DMB66_14395 [Actinoplanes sp. ATCC 53533]